MQSLKDINIALAKSSSSDIDPKFYPPAERAGFNFGKSICCLIQNLGVNENEFIKGIIKPLAARRRFLDHQKEIGG